MNEVEKIEARIAALDERRDALDERLKRARAKAEAEDLKGRKAAEAALGKTVVDLLGDWKAIDPASLTSWLEDHLDEVREAVVGDAFDVKAALARYRSPKRVGSRAGASAKTNPQPVTPTEEML